MIEKITVATEHDDATGLNPGPPVVRVIVTERTTEGLFHQGYTVTDLPPQLRALIADAVRTEPVIEREGPLFDLMARHHRERRLT